MTTNPLAKWK